MLYIEKEIMEKKINQTQHEFVNLRLVALATYKQLSEKYQRTRALLCEGENQHFI